MFMPPHLLRKTMILFVVPDSIRDPFAERSSLEMDSRSRYACLE